MRETLHGVLLVALVGFFHSSGRPPMFALPGTAIMAAAGQSAGTPRPIQLAAIPADAELIYHAHEQIYTMKADGTGETQITLGTSRRYEHVAVSPDRKKVAANYWLDLNEGGTSSRIVVFDLEWGTETDLVPQFAMAGNGGVDWDRNGYVYFAGIESVPVPNPVGQAARIRNMAANDVFKVQYDGTGLARLTSTTSRGEADVSVSESGTMIAYISVLLQSPNEHTEVWVSDTNGSNRRLVFVGGKDRVTSVHDPELSPDNSRVIFSQVNPTYRNFTSIPEANTAHDVMSVNLDGSDPTALTVPGPICIIPDWKGSRIVFQELSDQTAPSYMGSSVINSDGSGQTRIKAEANSAKWIP